MSRRRRKRRDEGVNLTPLIDVVFLLLIFFMVSMSFSRETRLAVALPQAQGGAPEDEPVEPIRLGVDRAGRYAIAGQQLAASDVTALMAALQQAAGGDSSRPVIVAADGDAPHRAVVKVMDAATRLGFSRLRLAVEQPQETRFDE
ncbi:MAG: biopolymer transporter ExbD [Porticoccaceae bacterium]